MTKESYEKIFQKIRSKEYGLFIVYWSGKILTCFTMACYVIAVLINFLTDKWDALGLIIMIPAVSFMLVSLFRNVRDEQRPYEIYNFKPLIQKDTKGKSFPSRHVFSIFVIAGTLFWFYPVVACIMGIMGVILAVIRVISGVHFPKDVIVGAVAGMLCSGVTGIILLWL